MSFTEEQTQKINQLIDDRLRAQAEYILCGFKPVEAPKAQAHVTITPPVVKVETQKPAATNPEADLATLPAELRQYLTIKEDKIYSEYVATTTFIAINEALKKLGYTRIVDEHNKKDSHWRKQ